MVETEYGYTDHLPGLPSRHLALNRDTVSAGCRCSDASQAATGGAEALIAIGIPPRSRAAANAIRFCGDVSRCPSLSLIVDSAKSRSRKSCAGPRPAHVPGAQVPVSVRGISCPGVVGTGSTRRVPKCRVAPVTCGDDTSSLSQDPSRGGSRDPAMARVCGLQANAVIEPRHVADKREQRDRGRHDDEASASRKISSL